MKPLPQLLLLLIFIASPTQADYQAGLDAYANGDYPQAMQEWLQVTESPDNAENPLIYAEAHYAIAKLYWQGQGVDRDYEQVYAWLLKAAGLGHAGAMGKLGYLYTDGIGVPQDFNRAFEWYSKAARLGDVDALYNLGIFYLNGWGTGQDTTMAKQYLAAASAQGDAAAEQAFQQLMAMEPEEEIVEEFEPAEEAGITVGAATAPPQESPGPLIQNEAWILAQPPQNYTIQAIGLSNRQKLESLALAHENLAPFAIYTVQKTTRPIHVLIQGNYAAVEDARAARDTFPNAINSPERVWIRQYKKIQDLIKAETPTGIPVGAASAAIDDKDSPPQ